MIFADDYLGCQGHGELPRLWRSARRLAPPHEASSTGGAWSSQSQLSVSVLLLLRASATSFALTLAAYWSTYSWPDSSITV